MPRAPRARQPDTAERIRLFAEHHIVAVRTARRNGEIIAVKHATFGWMDPKQYYALEKVHQVMPLIEKAVEGGYRINAMIWGFNPEIGVGGIGISIPAGATLLGISVYNLNLELKAALAGAAHPQRLLELAWQVFGPFGAILSLMEQINNAIDLASSGGLAPPCDTAYGVFKTLAAAELKYESDMGAESVAAVQQLQQLFSNAQAQGCSWAAGASTWRDVKL